MASLSVTASVRCQTTMLTNSLRVSGRNLTLKLASVCLGRTPLNTHKTSRLRISCAAKPETIEKVCEIVRKQLALAPELEVTPDTKFSALGADSLDTVEIVMGLEEEFDINVEEDGSENITTVQEAADLIEKIIEKKAAPSAAV